jgi:hypothetical protein
MIDLAQRPADREAYLEGGMEASNASPHRSELT